MHKKTEALARLTPPRSPTSGSEMDSSPSTVELDLPNPRPLPTEDDINASHPQFTLLYGEFHSITMMEVIGPSPNTEVNCVMRPFAVRAELNPNIWGNKSLEVLVVLNDANTGEQMTANALAGDNIITGVQSEHLDKHGETILVFDFPICGLQILREGRFYFTYWFLDPVDETRAFWDLKGSPCKATHHPELCKQITTFCKSQLTPRIISER
jgi:hypothetical protein